MKPSHSAAMIEPVFHVSASATAHPSSVAQNKSLHCVVGPPSGWPTAFRCAVTRLRAEAAAARLYSAVAHSSGSGRSDGAPRERRYRSAKQVGA